MMELKAIQSKIHEIMGVKVMLDFGLAAMCGTETKRLKEAVWRNIRRFEGEDFMFEVTRDELSRSQIASFSKGGYNIKDLPFDFTELGVVMLSSVLHSGTAIEMNRSIMRTFMAVRQLLLSAPANGVRQFKYILKRCLPITTT